MSPIRDPRDRSLRRMERAVAREQRRRAEAPPAAPAAPPERVAPAPAPDRAWLEEDFEALPKHEPHGRRRAVAVARGVARLQAADHELLAAGGPLAAPAGVMAIARGQCEVELADGELALAHLPKALALAQRSELAVGDEVQLERRSAGELVVGRVLPRRSRLSRPDPFHQHRERVLAANLDLALVVASVREPPIAPGLIDRFLVALAYGGVAAALAVNKADLLPPERADDPELEQLAPYRSLGMPVVLVSARTGEGLEQIRTLLAGRTVAFVGHSGVGKSSLLNALAPASAAAVGVTSSGNRRGRHTTARARVYRLAGGTRVMDTPGIREFGLWRLSPAELRVYFEEFAPYAAACRFRDCTHRHEPRCAVRAAAARGDLPRYPAYLRILASLAPV